MISIYFYCWRVEDVSFQSPLLAPAYSGVANPIIWYGPKYLGRSKCLILGEWHHFVWKNTSQSTKWQYVVKLCGAPLSLWPPRLRLCLHTYPHRIVKRPYFEGLNPARTRNHKSEHGSRPRFIFDARFRPESQIKRGS